MLSHSRHLLPICRERRTWDATRAWNLRKSFYDVFHRLFHRIAEHLCRYPPRGVDQAELDKTINSVEVTVQIGRTAPATTVSHSLYPMKQHLKTALLMELLYQTETESVLVFMPTKHRIERIAQQLQKAGFEATSLQGNLPQYRRQAALDGFRTGSFKILVMTPPLPPVASMFCVFPTSLITTCPRV